MIFFFIKQFFVFNKYLSSGLKFKKYLAPTSIGAKGLLYLKSGKFFLTIRMRVISVAAKPFSDKLLINLSIRARSPRKIAKFVKDKSSTRGSE